MRAGEATFYDAFAPGEGTSCNLPLDGDRLVAAMNLADYRTAAACGTCVVVAGPGGDVLVRVVDVCPACKPGGLDLSREAFARLAPHDAGRIPIRWQPVPCAVAGPIAYHFKAGSNPFWTAIQVRNHRYPIASVAVQRAGGEVQLVRQTYNYWVGQNLGEGPYTIKITDERGHVQVDTGIALGADAVRTGSAQPPPCRD
jgi:expansin (peptidoglycan-binding protein)